MSGRSGAGTPPSMREIIRAKRDGGALGAAEIGAWIHGVAGGSVPDYQSAALLMAIVWRGMTRGETMELTQAMLRSGRVLDWSSLDRPTVDKHSTGGVGDKVSLALAPWVAACGAAVPMIAGRGLGHTGGTLDKLEAIPGFRTRIEPDAFAAQLRRIGVVMAGASRDLAPADAALYALRDVTATVESAPLIVASVLSKKVASGTKALVFDVKTGEGAFLRAPEEARALAGELVAVARLLGVNAGAWLTRMDAPLGEAIGNANETAEAFAVLRGDGPSDVAALTRALGASMLVRCGIARDAADAERRLDEALRSGAAVARAEAMVEAQGGDPRAVTDASVLPRAPVETPVPAPRDGFVAAWDARALGELLVRMGGGRARKEDSVDPAVGIRILRPVGAPLRAGEPAARVATRLADDGAGAAAAVARALTVADRPPDPGPLLIEEISDPAGGEPAGKDAAPKGERR
ncbi:MAG TPA: thymidine phosphorylase [Acidobacteriota bacterium]|nr:thymidine phosphorylase [Acidobacteriota bacterium]